VDYNNWAFKVEQFHNVKILNKKKVDRKKKIYRGDNREIFVSGLDFGDIMNEKKTAVRYRMRDERRAKFLTMIDRFGEIVEVRSHWKKGFLFVVFKEEEVALQVVNLLSSFEGETNKRNEKGTCLLRII